MGVVKKQTVSKAWLNSAANAGTLNAGDFYVVERDGTYQATSGSTFVKIEQAEVTPLPDFGSAAFADVSDFATATQGALAESAVQSVKTLNGIALEGEGDVILSNEVPLWVSGTAYAAGKYVVSPASWHQYIRLTAGAGTTDPATDKTNWRLIGSGGIKSIQRGNWNFTAANTTDTITVSAVDVSASRLTLLGVSGPSNATVSLAMLPRIQLASSTTISAARGVTGVSVTFTWELTEYWS